MNAESGALINNRYLILGILGRGGQGTVYRVSDTLENNNLKALKTLSPASMDAMLRFEFEQAKQLEHPNLARIFDLGKVASLEGADEPLIGTLFFTQELVDGVPSHLWIRTAAAAGQNTVLAAARIGAAAARCLDLVHHSGLLHRDVKPSNILVGNNGQSIKLIDFGLAVSRSARDGLQAGTAGYTAEEALHGFQDERSDIYSLGITLIELVTGRRPRAFLPSYPKEVMHSIPDTSGGAFLRVVLRMCDPKPEARFESAQDVVVALAKAVGPEVLEQAGDSRYVDAACDTAAKKVRAARARSPRLAGRVAESAALSEWMEDAAHGSVKIGVLKGPPGVGKSRLFKAAATARQLRSAEQGHVPPQFLSGSLRSLLRSVIGASFPCGALLRQWMDGVSRPEGETYEANEDALVFEMAEAFWQLSQPTIVLIEADEPRLALALLGRLSRRSRSGGSYLAVMAEIQEPASASEPAPSTDDILCLAVHPLRLDEETEMIAQALGRDPSLDFAKKLHNLTGGIPLVTEALLLALLQAGADGDIESVSIEASFLKNDPVDAAVKGFVAGLDPIARDAAETLSVIGAPTSMEDLKWALSTDDEAALVRTLLTLEKNGWADIDNGFVSIKPLVAERLKSMLSLSQLKTLHKRALALCDKNRTGLPWQTADHAFFAGLSDRAGIAAKSAFQVLSSAGDLSGAAVYLHRAITLRAFSDEDADRMTVRLARLYRQTGDYNLAVAAAESVEKQGGAFSLRAALEKALSLRLLGKIEAAVEILQRLMKSEDPAVQVEALSMAARMDLERGDIDAAKARIAAVSLDALPSEGRPEILAGVGLVALSTGDAEQAEIIFERGLTEATENRDYKSLARFNGLLGMHRHRAGNFEDAAERYSEASAFAKKAGDRHGAATYTVNLAAARTEQGAVKEALDAYREGLMQLRLFGRPGELSQAGANYAELLFRMGDLEGAESASRSALEDARQAKTPVPPSTLCIRGDILISLKRYDEARPLLQEAEASAASVLAAPELASARLHQAALALETSDLAEASKKLGEAAVAQCDAVSSLRIEHRRLSLCLAEAQGENVEASLAALTAVLPTADADFQDEHLKAFAKAAKSASLLGQKEIAVRAARAAKDITLRMQSKTPSLYQAGSPPFLKEMNMILQSESGASPSGIHLSEWEHLARINTRLNSEFRVGRLLEMIMDAALDITHAERGFLLIASPEGELKIRCARNMDKESLSLDQEGFSRGAALKAFESKEPLLTTDAREDARFNEMRSVIHFNLRYIAAVPLLVDGKAQGTIYLDSKKAGRFDESRLTLLEALADQAAIALTNARLRTEIERRQQRIEKLNRELSLTLKSREGELKEVKGELEKQTIELIGKYRYEEIIARSKSMTQVFRLLDKVVASDFPVIIEGESGTGKELVARAVHFNSARKKKPFVAENCAAIPETLMESVLFGHVKGAFTGATADSRGLFVEADGGTLFLDEVSELSLSMQAKLLRVLQNSEIRPVGGTKTRSVNVRVLTATNANLKSLVSAGSFREDLFYRLNVIDITLPPLRKRQEDILLLAEHFIQKHSAKKKRITKAAAEILMDFSWPGNVRQLENEIIRAAVLSNDEIAPEHLSPDLLAGVSRMSNVDMDLDITKQVDRLKKRLLIAALGQSKGNQTAAAAMLGISRFGLQKMIKRLGV